MRSLHGFIATTGIGAVFLLGACKPASTPAPATPAFDQDAESAKLMARDAEWSNLAPGGPTPSGPGGVGARPPGR